MKGATHNLVVRTRTDVALYVLNHKRGHLRDLENSFKVTLSVIADPTVSGQQSFIIDRGEQVHTLEAAKALLAAQVAAFPSQTEEAFDEDEPFDIETEAEVETDETEGLADDHPSARQTARRTRCGRPQAQAAAPAARPFRRGRVRAARRATTARWRPHGARRDCRLRRETEEGETDEDEAEEQPGAGSRRSGRRRRAAAPPSRTPRRTPPAWRAGRRSGRIDCGRTRADIGSGSDKRGCRFRRRYAAGSLRRRSCSPNLSRPPICTRAATCRPRSAGSRTRVHV